MAAKEVKFASDARDRMLRGVDTLVHQHPPRLCPSARRRRHKIWSLARLGSRLVMSAFTVLVST